MYKAFGGLSPATLKSSEFNFNLDFRKSKNMTDSDIVIFNMQLIHVNCGTYL